MAGLRLAIVSCGFTAGRSRDDAVADVRGPADRARPARDSPPTWLATPHARRAQRMIGGEISPVLPQIQLDATRPRSSGVMQELKTMRRGQHPLWPRRIRTHTHWDIDAALREGASRRTVRS